LNDDMTGSSALTSVSPRLVVPSAGVKRLAPARAAP
jgi:hypothetical protein